MITENFDKENFDKVYNYLLMLQKEDGKIEADVMTFTKEMTKEEFQTGFEVLQNKASIVKGFEVAYLGYSYYKKEKEIVFSFGEINLEKEKEHGEEHSIQNIVE